MVLFSVIQYMVRLSIYKTPLSTDYGLYLWMFKLKFSISELAMISNIGLFLFLLSSIIFLKVTSKISIRTLILMGLPIVILFVMNSPQVGQRLYLYFERTLENPAYRTLAENSMSIVNLCVLLIYMSIPYGLLFWIYKKSAVYQTKKDIIITGTIWMFLDIGVVLIFSSELRYFTFLTFNLLKYPVYIPNITTNINLIIPILLLVAIVIVLLVVYTPFGAIGMRKKNVQLFHDVNKNIIMLLHTYKNAFCSISMFANDDNVSFIGSAEMRLKKVEEIANMQCRELSNTIDRLRGSGNFAGMDEVFDLIECIEYALSINVGPEIKVVRHYSGDALAVCANEFKISEVIVCILNNAVEALRRSVREPVITITCGQERGFAYINIRDNGCGIEKKNMGKIFNSLYSTKRGSNNYGFGLTYAKSVVEAHGGVIYVKSKEDAYTLVQITIPLKKSKKAAGLKTQQRGWEYGKD